MGRSQLDLWFWRIEWYEILGFHYANLHRENVKSIVFMEAAIQAPNWDGMPASVRFAIKMIKNPIFGPLMVKRANLFIKKMLPDLIKRKLTQEEMAHYARPYPDARSRQVLLRWPQDVPMNGKPAHVARAIEAYHIWLKSSVIPKLCFYVTPGVGFQKEDLALVQREFKNTKLVNLGEGNHFLQEDFPHEIGQEMVNWYRELEAKGMTANGNG